MEVKFSPAVKDLIILSREEALKNRNDFIGSEHLMLALLVTKEVKTIANLVFEKLNVDSKILSDALLDSLGQYGKADVSNIGSIPLTKEAEKILKISHLEAKIHGSLYFEGTPIVTSLHLLLSCLKVADSNAAIVLKKFNIDYGTIESVTSQSFLKEIEFIEELKYVAQKEGDGKEMLDKEHIKAKADETLSILSNTSPLSLYFDTSEYSNEDILEIISLLSDLYSNIGGDYLKITGMTQFERIVDLDLA